MSTGNYNLALTAGAVLVVMAAAVSMFLPRFENVKVA